MQCAKHKTRKHYGDAKIILTKTCKIALDAYVSYVRPIFLEETKKDLERKALEPENEEEELLSKTPTPKRSDNINPFDLLFLNSFGRAFTVPALNNALQSLTEKCNSQKKFTSTLNRKGTTTETAIFQPQLRKNVARFMYHHEKTAEKYYNAMIDKISVANTYLQTKKGSLLLQFSTNFRREDGGEMERIKEKENSNDRQRGREYGGESPKDELELEVETIDELKEGDEEGNKIDLETHFEKYDKVEEEKKEEQENKDENEQEEELEEKRKRKEMEQRKQRPIEILDEKEKELDQEVLQEEEKIFVDKQDQAKQDQAEENQREQEHEKEYNREQDQAERNQEEQEYEQENEQEKKKEQEQDLANKDQEEQDEEEKVQEKRRREQYQKEQYQTEHEQLHEQYRAKQQEQQKKEKEQQIKTPENIICNPSFSFLRQDWQMKGETPQPSTSTPRSYTTPFFNDPKFVHFLHEESDEGEEPLNELKGNKNE